MWVSSKPAISKSTTPLWVTVNATDGTVIEIIEQYPLEERERAYAMARRLAGLLDLPLKLLKDRDRAAQSLSAAPSNA
jgi:hypothetical protein